ncbi:alpha/beta fold hydrolase [Paenibacillus sp. J2TS4]|uniref:alpha/beta fold hydrolase n=1 Tax=Paenibacillus sp. J2TS4 TaxID=2807194 RepID=UPI001B2BB450|nr:alpha/beta hydrolase [Paenibacillus sp. J2TS4]GIP35496.1 alpha/beta hydrolase [Paenibacillus sp. J2TS4]
MRKAKLRTQGQEVELAYEDVGHGPAVALLHGFCGSSQYWKLVVPALANSYRLIIPDLRGHGQSSIPEGPYLMETMAEDIAELLEELSIGRAVLFGHSMGGYVAAAFAGKHPDILAGCALIHSTTLPDDEQGKQKRDQSITAIRHHGMAAFADDLIPKLFAQSNLTTKRQEVERVKEICQTMKPDGAVRSLQGMKERTDRTMVLKKTQVPVLLIAGSEDQVVTPDKTFAAEGEGISKFVLEGAGHMGMYEAPDELADRLKSFLDEIYS